jgi:hypothetical protein
MVNKKIRLSLDVTSEVYHLIEMIAARHGDSKSDVLRKGIALMKVANEANIMGHDIAIIDKKNKVVSRITNIF